MPAPDFPCPDVLAALGLPTRWRGQERFVVLDIEPGAATRFETLQAAWRLDPGRCERLIVLGLDGPDSHDLEGGRVQWMRLSGATEPALRGLQARVDAFVLHTSTDTGTDPGTTLTPDLLRRLGRLAAPGATLVTSGTDPAVRDGLARNGFMVETDITGCTQAHFAPRFTLPPPPPFARPSKVRARRWSSAPGWPGAPRPGHSRGRAGPRPCSTDRPRPRRRPPATPVA